MSAVRSCNVEENIGTQLLVQTVDFAPHTFHATVEILLILGAFGQERHTECNYLDF